MLACARNDERAQVLIILNLGQHIWQSFPHRGILGQHIWQSFPHRGIQGISLLGLREGEPRDTGLGPVDYEIFHEQVFPWQAADFASQIA